MSGNTADSLGNSIDTTSDHGRCHDERMGNHLVVGAIENADNPVWLTGRDNFRNWLIRLA